MKQVIVVTTLFLFFTSYPLTPFEKVNPIKRRGKLNLTNHLLERKKVVIFSNLITSLNRYMTSYPPNKRIGL